jgi:hypothetical protein
VAVVPDELPGRVIVTDPHAARAIARTVAPKTVSSMRRDDILRDDILLDDIQGNATPGFCDADVNAD